MDKIQTSNIIKFIQNTKNDEHMYKALVKLRTDLVKDQRGINLFFECNGVPLIVKLLKKPNEKLLEVVLSLLGNLCTEKKCASQAFNSGVCFPLVTILRSLENRIIQTRACRLLGNLVDKLKLNYSTIDKYLPNILSSIFDVPNVDDNNLQLFVMALRAIRILWPEKKFQQYFMAAEGLQKIVSLLIIITKLPEPIRRDRSIASAVINDVGLKPDNFQPDFMDMYSEQDIEFKGSDLIHYKIPENREKRQICKEIIRFILTSTTIDDSIVRVWKGGYKLLETLAEPDSEFRSDALKIISNLVKSDRRKDINDFITSASISCYLLTQRLDKPLSDDEIRYCIEILCLLASCSAIRSKIRRSGTLLKLLGIVKTTNNYRLFMAIIIGLYEFRYDELSIKLLVCKGIIPVLLKVLKEKTSEDTLEHTRLAAAATTGSEKLNNDFHIHVKFPCSPGSSSSSSCGSPSYQCGDENEFEYSPVCSDDETNDKPDESQECLDGTMLNILSIEEPEIAEEESVGFVETDECKTVEISDTSKQDLSLPLVMELLVNCARVEINSPDYVDSDAINILFRIYQLSFRDVCLAPSLSMTNKINALNITNTLNYIIKDDKHFIQLIQHEFLYNLFDWYLPLPHDFYHCIYCRVLIERATHLQRIIVNRAQTGYVRGAMDHLILTGSDNTKKRIAIAAGLLLRDFCHQKNILLSSGAVNIIIDLIVSANSSEMSEPAAKSLTILSKELGLTLDFYKTKYDLDEPKTSTNPQRDSYCGDETFDAIRFDDDSSAVMFVVGENRDSGFKIKFHMEHLTKYSDVFATMFNSDFIESQSKSVLIKDNTVRTIKFFLTCMYNLSNSKVAPLPPNHMIVDVLEVYQIAHTYMIPSLEQDIYSLFLDLTNAETVLSIFEYGYENGKEELVEIAIDYYLSGDMKPEDKIKSFKEAAISTNHLDWMQMIKDRLHELIMKKRKRKLSSETEM